MIRSGSRLPAAGLHSKAADAGRFYRKPLIMAGIVETGRGRMGHCESRRSIPQYGTKKNTPLKSIPTM